MRIWLILFLLLISSALALETITDFVHDEAGILDKTEETALRAELSRIAQQGIAEIAVVIVDTLEGEAIEDYALRLAHDRLGDSEEDNGLLLLVAIEDRAYRFEVGYGLEGQLNDAKVGRIGRDYLVPAFRQGNYATGIMAAIGAITIELGDNTTARPAPMQSNDDDLGGFLAFLTIFIIYLVIVGRKGRGRSGFFMVGPGFRGGRSGGFSFGGGGFGGGGAGGRW